MKYWVETDNTGDDIIIIRFAPACADAHSGRINHPDRLNYPMKRVGKREGKFERISWDEALDTIAASLKGWSKIRQRSGVH
jgi:Tat-targeted selenate reductase subunit YnfE